MTNIHTTYTIAVLGKECCTVCHQLIGYCEGFNGTTCIADAIRYIKKTAKMCGEESDFSFDRTHYNCGSDTSE